MLLLLAIPASLTLEIVRTWTARDNESVGPAHAVLGDVNGDGTPDFVFGSNTDLCRACGEGFARVCSGVDGAGLYTVKGADAYGFCGDDFGSAIESLGDLDGDGIGDFAVGAWMYENERGSVTVISGHAGEVLATLCGPTREGGLELTLRGRPPSARNSSGASLSGFGRSIVALGDLDADGVPDFAVRSNNRGSRTRAFSGASFEELCSFEGEPLSGTMDVDGDGARDLLVLHWGEPRSGRNATIDLRSSRTGALVRGFAPGYVFTGIIAAGDRDGDGFEDLLVDRGPSTPFGDTRTWLEMDLISGRTGAQLQHLEASLGEHSIAAEVAMAGDLDSDGRPEILITARHDPRADSFTFLSGEDGSVLAALESPSFDTGGRLALAGKGPVPIVLAGGGAVHLVRLRLAGK